MSNAGGNPMDVEDAGDDQMYHEALYPDSEDGFMDEDEEQDTIIDPEVEVPKKRLGIFDHLRRPDFNVADIKGLPLDLMVVEVDYDYEQLSGNSREAYVRIFALDKMQHTYMLKVYGFLSYFYVRCPQQLETDKYELIAKFFRKAHITESRTCSYVKHEVVYKESIMNYKAEDDRKDKFLKVYMRDPRDVSKLKENLLIERSIAGVEFDPLSDNEDSHVFEANMAFALRFMIDKGIVGMGWIRVDENFEIDMRGTRDTRCQAVLRVKHQQITAYASDDVAWSGIAPLRIMSFDIECIAKKGFPNAQFHPIITIAIGGKIHTQKKEDFRVILQLKECSEVSGSSLHCFDDEIELLAAFEELMQVYDPDILTGYNIIGFDMKYILDRIETLTSKGKHKQRRITDWTRIQRERATKKKAKIQSKAMGNRDTFDIHITGRIQLDMLIVMMIDHKLSSYSLNNVCMNFLGEQKEDVHYSIMWDLQEKGPDTRKRIASYCLKDALLPLRLIDKLKNVYNYVEMARVTGVPINVLLKRGQQIKVLSQLYRETPKYNMIIPSLRPKAKTENSNIGYQGGFVLEPKTAFYKIPIATLDFASLYPSIMIAHNICYTTKIEPRQKNLASLPQTLTPSNHRFAKPHVRKGILPLILENLLNARKRAKKLLEEAKANMKTAKSEHERVEFENLVGVYNGRQLALKISANSVYGFTGAQIGALPCLAIAGSVTAFGRQMIENTRDWVTEEFNIKNGYEFDSDIVYGDTDSVMIRFGTDNVAKAMELGKLASQIISKKFISPIKLEFEKVYYPYLLLKKKKYAGLLWTNPDKHDYKDCKGLEMVRRDNCLMARKATEKVLDTLLVKKDETLAKEYVMNLVNDLLNNRIDISELVITKSLSKAIGEDGKATGYKTNSAHVALAEKIAKRNPGNAPGIGDRIPFVILKGTKNQKLYERSEDPVFAMDNECPLDLDYYVENQLRGPIDRIFEVVFPHYSGNDVFQGKATLSITSTQQVSKQKGMGMFVSTVYKCTPEFKTGLSCTKPYKGDQKDAICEDCKVKYPYKEAEIYTKQNWELRSLQEEYKYLWTECQRCQGTRFDEIICSNNDCPIFYRRKKVIKDIDNCADQLERFSECSSTHRQIGK